MKNIWILKPSFTNRGRGIHIIDNIEDLSNIIHKIGLLNINKGTGREELN